jgi:ribonuclease HII
MNKIARLIAGVDEAGRGPLAGPVVCAAVILDPKQPIEGLGDSKALSEKKREQLFPLIQECSLAWKIIFINAQDIDRLNIFKATMEGMRRAVNELIVKPGHALIDGNKIPPGLRCSAEALVKGDARETCIMAASILAKVARDAYMIKLHEQFPQYAFAQHKGYPTAIHFESLKQHGPCPEHRRSFAPVREVIELSLL